MVGMAVTQQSPFLMTLQVNQVQATGDEDASKEVVREETVTKDVTGEADASTNQHTHHRSKHSREELMIFLWH